MKVEMDADILKLQMPAAKIAPEQLFELEVLMNSKVTKLIWDELQLLVRFCIRSPEEWK